MVETMKLCVLLILLCAVFNCDARPEGAPLSACKTLTPIHQDIAAMNDKPPYTVTTVKSGDKIKVTVSSPIGDEFQGFMIQARAATDRSRFIDGEFSESEVAKTENCFDKNKNTLTHINPIPKKEVVTEWTPSDNVNEDIVFRATIAKTFAIFWTEVDSTPIKVGTADNAGTLPEPRKLSNPDGSNIYGDCFVSKGCFGLPSGCAERHDCEVLLTYYATPRNTIEFDMHGFLGSSRYMAMGLSKDPLMGDDLVTECIMQDSGVVVRKSWNEGKSNTRTHALEKEKYFSSFSNGLSSCSWSESLFFKAHGQNFTLGTRNYYVLLAKGDVSNGRLVYHESRIPSGVAVNFTAFESVAGEGVTDSVKVHGTFMVTAWVGFVSFAILLARHFKNTWEDRTLGGVKIWFALHRAFMILGLSFVIVAFIVIFIHKNGWNYETTNPHAILGCIASALGLFNPIMAAFRPAPDHPKRPIFNWLHWGVGNSAQIFAIIAVFFAVSLPSSGLNKRFYWVMAIFVIVHLIFHLLYQVHTWTQGRKKSDELAMNNMSGARSYNLQNEQTSKTASSDSQFRIYMLSIYTTFILTILISLYSLIGVA